MAQSFCDKCKERIFSFKISSYLERATLITGWIDRGVITERADGKEKWSSFSKFSEIAILLKLPSIRSGG